MDRMGILLICLMCASTRILGQNSRCLVRRSLGIPCPCTIDNNQCVHPSSTDCAPGYYKSGNRCYQCSVNCKNRRCDSNTERCDDCVNGFHGDTCDSRCSTIQSGTYTQCTQCTQNGRCTACSNNFQASTCTDCASGYYKSSNRCYQCSSYCKARPCNRDTGKCGGCVDGRYGDRCNNNCQTGCARCDQDTGDCTACSVNTNLKFPGCTDCEDGYYRQSPSISYCSICQGKCYDNAPCNKTTGHCQQCPPGKKGDTCNQACDAGMYGLGCLLPCGHCQGGGACDPESGTCPLCHPGYYPPTCQDACSDKTYGQKCSEICGQCKGEQPCDKETGECTDGCQAGYIGALCKTQCEAGLYGERCNETCGNCQVNTTCHHEDGHCLVACVADFTGPLCLQDTTNDDSATNLVGPIVGAILVVGVLMTITGAICWCRKSKGARSSGQNPPKTSPISKQDSAPKGRPEPSPVKQSSSNERRDPENIYEIYDIESNYDKLSPYSNDDASRDPYMQLTSQANDVKTPALNDAYVNAELSL